MEARPARRRLGPRGQAAGKWVHVGRVNTLQRIRWFMALGVDSIDGSEFARFTRARLPMGVATLAGPTQQTLL